MKYGSEFELAELISEEDFVDACYCPSYKKQKKISRHKNAKEQIELPLFSKFIFVKFNFGRMPWYVVTKHRNVEGFLSVGATPLPIRESEIDKLRRDCEFGSYNEKGIAGVVQKGDKIEIKYDGTQWSPFIGFVGEFQSLTEKGNAIIELSLFGRSTKLEISTGMIEKLL